MAPQFNLLEPRESKSVVSEGICITTFYANRTHWANIVVRTGPLSYYNLRAVRGVHDATFN